MSVTRSVLLVLLLTACAGGCAGRQRENPSFAVTRSGARDALREMRKSRVRLARPLVILGGFSDPGIGSSAMRSTMRRLFDDGEGRRILAVNFTGTRTFEDCRRRVIRAVNEAFPSDDPKQTAEVDVIGLSMGGLVARFAADESGSAPRLRVARLFTIASPLRGANAASSYRVVLTSMHRDMRAGSALLRRLNGRPPNYPLHAYTRLDDRVVGEAFAAPAGQSAWWLDNGLLEHAHLSAMRDPRILADIARRLRGEAPFATDP